MNLQRTMLIALLSLPMELSAYEIGTHAYVTKAAVDASVLSPTHPRSIVPVLGFERLDNVKPFEAVRPAFDVIRASYYDNAPRAIIPISSDEAFDAYLRDLQNEEGNIFERLRTGGYLPGVTSRTEFEQRIEAWVMRGAIREDDNDVGPYSLGDRDDDPWNVVFRAGRHFYDPINNRGLFSNPTCFTFGCKPAIEWAMGRIGVLAGPGTLDTSRENHFSWQDARDNYWWALTYNRINEDPFGTHDEAQRIESGNRKLRFATALKAVGQVVHLLQDMAQPQHTRNDSHGPPIAQVATVDSFADGAFEAYTEARLFQSVPVFGFSNPLSHFDGSRLTDKDLPALRLGGNVPYPVPSFSTAVKFFTTQNTDAVAVSRGMADLSNRGFFTASTLPINILTNSPDPLVSSFNLAPPLPTANPGYYQETPVESSLYFSGNVVVRTKQLIGAMPDVLAPNWNVQSGLFQKYSADGRMPLIGRSQLALAVELAGTPSDLVSLSGYTMSYEVFNAQADAMLPRAVGYSTGLINYFFRGRLEITPNTQNLFAVMNQGEPHTVDAEGYPRRPDNRIFGFEKLRLKIRNVTEAIVESGPVTTPIPQTSGMGRLVAVARYHRNVCYKRDMSGERQQGYALPPALGAITEPSCSGLTQRTDYPEISVSAPITIASVADLPGGSGVAGSAAAIDQVFDFTDDPVPVNATDLFIQVVYRGQLGDEPDGIAVGSYDVREPTFIGIYNNTDYYWNPGVAQWVAQMPTGPFPQKNIDAVRACVAGTWAYSGFVVGTVPPLGFPAPNSGVIRLAMIFAKPLNATQQFSVRVTPVVLGGVASPEERFFPTRGQQHQANKERIETSVLNTPLICTETAPTANAYWCNTPIKKRRGQPFGEVAALVGYVNGFGAPADPDALPLPTFPGVDLTTTGTIKYNDEMLSNCPAAPTTSTNAKALIELLERAAYEGIDIGG